MKKVFILAIAGLAVLASCQKQPTGPVSVEYSATGASFKDGPAATWQTGDQIGIFSNGKLNILTATTSGNKATFVGEMEVAATCYAITPVVGTETIDGTVATVYVPEVQEYVKNGISADSAPAVAITTDKTLAFKSIVGAVKMTITRDDIKSIKFTADENVAGTVNVTIDGNKNKVTVVTGAKSVSLGKESGNLDKNAAAYAAILPGTFNAGITVTFENAAGLKATKKTEDLTVIKAGETLDLGEFDSDIEFKTPRYEATPANLGFKGDGETLTASFTTAFVGGTSLVSDDWLTALVNGNTVTVEAAANTDAENARYGSIIISGNTADGPAEVFIPVAQAAAGCNILYDSFLEKTLSDSWVGDKTRSNLTMTGNGISLTGNGDQYDAWTIFYKDLKVRQKYNDSGSCNKWILTIDIKADGGCAGMCAFNQYGYKIDGTYDYRSAQNYLIFSSGTKDESNPDCKGGYYCYNCTNANAMDDFTAGAGGYDCGWYRIECSNIERNSSGVGGDWGGKYVWTLKADENGVLHKDKLVMSGGMWFWNDSPQLGMNYGYFGVFAKDTDVATIRNFTLSYQDNQ